MTYNYTITRFNILPNGDRQLTSQYTDKNMPTGGGKCVSFEEKYLLHKDNPNIITRKSGNITGIYEKTEDFNITKDLYNPEKKRLLISRETYNNKIIIVENKYKYRMGEVELLNFDKNSKTITTVNNNDNTSTIKRFDFTNSETIEQKYKNGIIKFERSKIFLRKLNVNDLENVGNKADLIGGSVFKENYKNFENNNIKKEIKFIIFEVNGRICKKTTEEINNYYYYPNGDLSCKKKVKKESENCTTVEIIKYNAQGKVEKQYLKTVNKNGDIIIKENLYNNGKLFLTSTTKSNGNTVETTSKEYNNNQEVIKSNHSTKDRNFVVLQSEEKSLLGDGKVKEKCINFKPGTKYKQSEETHSYEDGKLVNKTVIKYENGNKVSSEKSKDYNYNENGEKFVSKIEKIENNKNSKITSTKRYDECGWLTEKSKNVCTPDGQKVFSDTTKIVRNDVGDGKKQGVNDVKVTRKTKVYKNGNKIVKEELSTSNGNNIESLVINGEECKTADRKELFNKVLQSAIEGFGESEVMNIQQKNFDFE